MRANALRDCFARLVHLDLGLERLFVQSARVAVYVEEAQQLGTRAA